MATWARRLFKFRKDRKLRAILRQFVQSRFTKTFVFANIFAQKCSFLLKASQNFLLFRIFPLATFLRKGKSKFSRKDENKTFRWYFPTAVNIYVRHGNQLVDSTAPSQVARNLNALSGERWLAKLAENIRASPFKEDLSIVYHIQPNSSSWTIHKMFFFQTLYKQAPILRFSFATVGIIIKKRQREVQVAYSSKIL